MATGVNARTSGALRDYLLKVLSVHPGTREFHLHTLVTAPRKSSSLYPFATPRPPRSYMQDILILLSEQSAPHVDESAPDNRRPRVMVSAIEATLYVLPSTLCSVLYVCKVDSTGQAGAPSPTALLVRSLLRFYLDPKTRPIPRELTRHLYLHIFARAQAQYLFSASKEWPGKHPLSDTKLCAWWKRCVSRVVADLAADEARDAGGSEAPAEGLKMKLYYVLPGLSAFEAENSLRLAGPAPPSLAPHLEWKYGHPYNSDDHSIPLPCPPPPDAPVNANNKRPHSSLNLGCYIPYFDDDPKSRFIDEIAHTTDGDIISPTRKKPRTALDVIHQKSRKRKQDDDVMPSLVGTLNAPSVVVTAEDEDVAKEEEEREKEKEAKQAQSLVPLGELGKVTPDEFWERMSFRQECIAGAITGFFTLVVSSPPPPGDVTPTYPPPNPLAPQPGQVPEKLNKRIMKILQEGVEFSTFDSAAKSTQTIENAIRGLCDGVPPVLPVSTSAVGSLAAVSAAPSTPNIIASNILGIPINIPQRSSTPEPDSPRKNSNLLAPPSTPPRRGDVSIEVSPNPFDEVVASKDTYDMYIYGSVVTRNPVKEMLAAGGEGGTGAGTDQSPTKRPVTVLTVRKKVKKKPT